MSANTLTYQSLPREVRSAVNRQLIQLPNGLQLLAVEMSDVPAMEAEHQIILHPTKTSRTSSKMLATFTTMRAVSKQVGEEMLTDFFFFNAVQITIVRRAAVGNGPPAGLTLPKSIRIHLNTVTFSAARKSGSWSSTGGGPDLGVMLKTESSPSGRLIQSGTALADDEISQAAAEQIDERAGFSLHEDEVGRIVTLLALGSDVI